MYVHYLSNTLSFEKHFFSGQEKIITYLNDCMSSLEK